MTLADSEKQGSDEAIPRGHRWDYTHRLHCRGSSKGDAWRVGVASSGFRFVDVIIVEEAPTFSTVAEKVLQWVLGHIFKVEHAKWSFRVADR